MVRQVIADRRAVQSARLAAVIAADPRLCANDEARRARDDAATLALKARSQRAAEAQSRAKARMTSTEREKARAQAKREREAAKRRAVREAAAEKLKAEKAAAREVAKKAAARAKKVALRVAWDKAKADAIARGEPFTSDEQQKVYMEAQRDRDRKAAKAAREGAPAVPEWDSESVPWD